jgi:hypothetical protein
LRQQRCPNDLADKGSPHLETHYRGSPVLLIDGRS